jgi:hypothetical protein
MCTSGNGNSVMSSPDSGLWIERGVRRAQPPDGILRAEQASPPKNTYRVGQAIVSWSTLGV